MLRNKQLTPYNNFRLPCPPLAKRGSLTHSQALALSKRARDVTALLCCFPKIIPSFFTIKEGSTSHLGLLPSGKKRKTALRCSEPLRSKVGGASKPSPWLCGMGPLGCYGDQLAIILLKVSAWRGYPPLLP